MPGGPDASIVQTILSTGARMGANQMQLLSALSAGLVESGMQNLKYGDRDSQGVFQQRPSQGWGTVAQVTDPTYAATQFFDRLLKLPWSGTPGQMAQKVQQSAYPDRYDSRMSEAQQLLARYGQGMTFTGLPGGLDLSLDLSSQTGGPPELEGPEDRDGELLATMLQSISDRVAGRAGGRFMPQLQPSNEVEQNLVKNAIALPDAYVPLGGQLGEAGQLPALGPPSTAPFSTDRLQPVAVRAAQLMRRAGFTGTIGGYGTRSGPTDHDDGLALDFMTNEDKESGYQIAEYFRRNNESLGVSYVIFDGRIASRTDDWSWRRYRHYSGGSSPTLRHENHPHVSFVGG